VWDVIELRSVVDGTEESGQVVEKRIVAAADVRLDRVVVRCIDVHHFVGIDNGRKVAAREVDELHGGALRLIDSDPNLRGLQLAKILDLGSLDVFEQPFQAVLVSPDDSGVRGDQDAVKHVRVQDAGLGNGGERQGYHHLLSTLRVVAREPEQIVQVGGIVVNVRKNRVYCVGIVMIGHEILLVWRLPLSVCGSIAYFKMP